MALRKPLVVVDGLVQQLGSGDTLDAPISEVDLVSLTNNNASAITIGQPVYSAAADACDLAKADAIGTARPIGLVKDASIAASASGNIQTDGILSNSDWTSVIGSTTLTSGSVYYLDNATAGKLTATAPTSGFVVKVGIAISTTEMAIDIESPIGL